MQRGRPRATRSGEQAGLYGKVQTGEQVVGPMPASEGVLAGVCMGAALQFMRLIRPVCGFRNA